MIVLTVLALVGLIIFIVGGLLWLLVAARRSLGGILAVVGLLIWAIVTVITGLMSVF